MTGSTLIGLILITTILEAGIERPGKSGLIVSNRSVKSMVTSFLRAGNTGTRKINKTGSRSLILRTGKVMTGRNSTGVI